MDKHVPKYEPDGSIDCDASHWQNFTAQEMLQVEVSGPSGRQSHIAINQQNAELAQNFGSTLSLGHQQDIMAERSLGKSEEPHGFVDYQVGLDAEGFDNYGRNLHLARSQGAGLLRGTHEKISAPRSLGDNGHHQSCGTGREHRLSFQGLQGNPVSQSIHDTPSDTCNKTGGSQGVLSHWTLHTRPSTRRAGEGRSAIEAALNPYSAHATGPTANAHNDAEKDHPTCNGLHAAHILHDSFGIPLVSRNVHSRFANNLPVQNFYHDPSNAYTAGGQGQPIQHNPRDILAARYHRHANSIPGDIGGQGNPLSEGSLLARKFDDDPNKMLEAQGLHNNPPFIYNTRGCASSAPRKLYDAYGNVSSPQNCHRNVPRNVFNEPVQLPIQAGSSDHVSRCLTTLHTTSTTSASSVPADQATDHHDDYNHQHPHQQSNNFSIRTTPCSSSSSSSVFGSNEPSIGTTTYVSITSPPTTKLLHSSANSIAASSQRNQPLTGPSLSKDHSPSSLSSASSSSSNTYTVDMFPPRGIVISDADIERAMAYCFDRGNGQFTRLVPVDVLPFPLRDLPSRVTSDEGLIVLPVPRVVGPDGQSANAQLVLHVAGNNVTVSSASFQVCVLTFPARVAFVMTSFGVD